MVWQGELAGQTPEILTSKAVEPLSSLALRLWDRMRVAEGVEVAHNPSHCQSTYYSECHMRIETLEYQMVFPEMNACSMHVRHWPCLASLQTLTEAGVAEALSSRLD